MVDEIPKVDRALAEKIPRELHVRLIKINGSAVRVAQVEITQLERTHFN